MSKNDTPSGNPSGLQGFGERLAEARVRAGFKSQAKLAQALGISVMTVSRHENGRYPPRPDIVKAYAGALHVSESFLLHGLAEEAIQNVVSTYLASPKAKSLLPEVGERLRRFPWTELTAGTLDEIDVHTLAKVIDRNLRLRRNESHDPSRGLSHTNGTLTGGATDAEDLGRDGDRPARARA